VLETCDICRLGSWNLKIFINIIDISVELQYLLFEDSEFCVSYNILFFIYIIIISFVYVYLNFKSVVRTLTLKAEGNVITCI
jgi:hypothetical protein